MMTKPWTPPPRQAEEASVVHYSVDLPCLMSGAGTPFAGPFPLTMCMLQGLRLARMASKFEIKSEDGDRLLELRDGKVWGIPVLVDMFLRSSELAESMFQDMLEDMREAVASEQRNDI